MSRLFVPISCRHYVDDVATLSRLKAMGASRVYASIGERFPFEKGERRDRILQTVREKNKFYSDAGIEFALWIDTFGFGGGSASYNEEAAGYTRIRSIIGREQDDAFCPLDEGFTEMTCELVRDLCRTGIRMLMLDDEMCLSVRPGIGCACELHMAEYCRRLGEDISLEQVVEKAFMGKPGRYRDIWLDLMGETMRDFCRKIRAAVDEVDPDIRLGFCSGFTSWDLEGADAIELTRILAGKNKPFLRFTGAPYWVANRRFARQPLTTVIECARMQFALCGGSDIEVFAEGDTYPRNRYNTPAAYSECFELATRASDGMDILKYMFTYECPTDYDSGYVKAHLRNQPLREEIDRVFGDKKCIGVRIYDTVGKIRGAELPVVTGRAFNHDDEKRVECLFFNSEEKLLTANNIPTVYEGEGLCGIAFGENARYLTDDAFKKGLIIDIKAALILRENGIDVGLDGCREVDNRFMEYFGEDRRCILNDTPRVYEVEPRSGARVLSRFVSAEAYNGEEYPAAYYYENKKGQRFIVYAFDAESLRPSSSLFWSYERGRQIKENIEMLGGERLPAYCPDCPMLYQLCKLGDGRMAVALVNCHEDEAAGVRVELSRSLRNVRFINCTGSDLSDSELLIDNIKAFGFVGFEGEMI